MYNGTHHDPARAENVQDVAVEVDKSPLAQLTAIAASAEPRDVAEYTPTATDQALAGSLFSSNAPTFLELAKRSGVAESTLFRLRQDPARVAWIVTHSRHLANLGRGAVYARVLDQALTSRNPNWAKLYLELFDEEYKKGQQADQTRNTQVNIFGGMSDTELRSFVQQKTRQVFGKAE